MYFKKCNDEVSCRGYTSLNAFPHYYVSVNMYNTCKMLLLHSRQVSTVFCPLIIVKYTLYYFCCCSLSYFKHLILSDCDEFFWYVSFIIRMSNHEFPPLCIA